METVFRVAIIYLFVLVGLRLLGKREFGQLSPLELVTLLMIPEIVSQALTGDDHSLTNALVGVSTLLVLVLVTSVVMHRFRRVETAITGEPSVLVADGQLRPHVLNINRVSPDEVFSEMHKSGLDRLEQVRWAILETDGSIAIVPTEAARSKVGLVPNGKEQAAIR
ncbi:DUF421 domain-containing protein [Aquabacterium sp. A7-Y]|uniref:DUF421 domain-containing protein n=1 Tax=Aquabacterium sp. A7-Y TaxID=1349605 RepID=UPI00223DCE69|nr:YetF domain-containing protein [Aquabacterium sp. A7-Y]MCW7537388.1 DUF421 domain-containing protein [Aquabacterium sp. A7-Y]